MAGGTATGDTSMVHRRRFEGSGIFMASLAGR